MTVGDLNQEEDWGIENDFDCAVPEKDRHKAELHVAKSLMEEGDWVEVSPETATVHDESGAVVERKVVQTALSGAAIGKGQYRHFMQKEIFEQPAVIGDTLHAFLNPLSRELSLPALPFDLGQIPRITISACGTAFLAGMVAKYWFEQIARQPVEIDPADIHVSGEIITSTPTSCQ